MAKSDRPRGPREHEHEPGHGDGDGERGRHGDRDGDGERGRRGALGRDYPVFAKVRGARWQGSAPPTAQAFARGLAQWRRLPGAIGATAADLGNASTATEPPPASEPDDTGDEP